MTGYGKAVANLENGNLTVEIRTLNSKNADINLKSSLLPKDKELGIRTKISGALQRGTIDVFLTWEPNAAENAKLVNMALAKEYFRQISELGAEIGARNLMLDNPNELLAMLLCAAAIGLLLHALGVSAGAMIGAMIGSAAYCILRGKQKYPAALKTALQLCSGAYIGCRIDHATILGFGDLLLPLLIMLLGILAFTFMTSSLMCRLSRLSRSTAMLASTPGGIQEMSLLSEELGADTPSVAVLHTARIVFVILLFPYLIQLLLRLIPA